MNNKRIAEIIFRTIYVTLGFIGIIGSLGYFNKSFSSSFYVMYTNLSNYLCIGIILYLLIKCIRGKEEEAIDKQPELNSNKPLRYSLNKKEGKLSKKI